MLEEQKKFAEKKNPKHRSALLKRNQTRVEESESTVIQLDPEQPAYKMVKK